MHMEKHDLFDFFQEANRNIETEYLRICRSVAEDPGTAGDQGEENWKKILELWLPSYYHIETKGRILFENGETSPQVDIIVLSPEYPRQLWGCKRYLSGGVVAAFECKTTLKRDHIRVMMETSRFIREHTSEPKGTPRKDLQSRIYYGLLAHSHDWKGEKSKPLKNIIDAIHQFDRMSITHPFQMPDIICVADLAVWKKTILIMPKQPGLSIRRFDHNHIEAGYTEFNGGSNEFYTPVGSMIFDVLNHLAWDNKGLRDIVLYMRKLGITGSGVGLVREWGFDLFSETTIENMKTNAIINGGMWDEWSMSLT